MTDTDKLKRLAEAAMTRTKGGAWRADPYGIRQIWADSLKGGDAHIADIRGWGYFTGRGRGALGLSDEEGIEAQAQIAAFVAAANPQTILALIAENEAKDRLNTELREANNQYRDRYIAAEGALRQISADPHRDPVAIADDVLARIDAK